MATMTTDGRRMRGEVSRRAVMRVAVNLASAQGLEGLSIGGLAAKTAMSKGGVVALFGTKEQLQLATIAAASEVFRASVIAPALETRGGLERLRVLIDAWLRYSETRVFEGGCFFAAAASELGSQRGAVRDAVAEAMRQWQEFVRHTITRAIEQRELPATTDAALLTFEITSLLDGANSMSLLFDNGEPYGRARDAIGRLLSPLG